MPALLQQGRVSPLASRSQSPALPGRSWVAKMPFGYHPWAFGSMGTPWYWQVSWPGRSAWDGARTQNSTSALSLTLICVIFSG